MEPFVTEIQSPNQAKLNSSTLPKKFVNILQGKTGRWIAGESKMDGLYTDEITVCKKFRHYRH